MEMEVLKNEQLVDTYAKIYGDECRICLKRAVEICELFRNGDAIPRKLMAVASVQVEEGDGLPPVICLPCNERLDASYDFKCQIQKSDEKFREILKLKSSDDSLTSASIVTAIIADVISSVITSEKDNMEKQDVCSANFCPDNFCFSKDDTSFCLSAERNLFSYEKEPQSQLSSTQLENVNVYKSLLETNPTRQVVSMKDEVLSSLDNSMVQNTNTLLKVEGSEPSESGKILKGTLNADSMQNGTQDDEERPLISRTHRLHCAQCIKSFRTKVALQRHAIIHKCKTKLRYVCYVCDKQYSTLAKVKNHAAICYESHSRKESVQEKGIKHEKVEGIVSVQDKRINNIQDKRAKTLKTEDTPKEQRKSLKFTCKVCSKQFTYQKSFITHANSHPEYKSEELDDSSQCSTKEKSADIVEGEEENDEEEDEEDEEDENLPAESLQCTQCGKLFATKRNLKRHLSTHSGLKYTCGTCGKGFSRVDKLKDHEQSKHKAEIFDSSDLDDKDDMDNINKGDCLEGRKKDRHNRPHKCAICPKSFAQAQSLANHMERHKRVKETQKRFLCEVCSKCFAQSGSLVAHMRTHTGVKPYVCNVCSRAFTKSTYLQLHLRTHSGEKPYICQYCSRAFARANTLARHITMHTGEAKYHCQICTKSFRRLTSLNEHTYTHTGQRPYACKICTKRYNNAGSLYAHRKKCKAQQLPSSGFEVSVDDSVSQQDVNLSQVLIYSQKKLVEDATVGQVTPVPQYMIANVHNQKTLGSNIIPPFTVEDPNVYTINSKQFKNPYYSIYPNM